MPQQKRESFSFSHQPLILSGFNSLFCSCLLFFALPHYGSYFPIIIIYQIYQINPTMNLLRLTQFGSLLFKSTFHFSPSNVTTSPPHPEKIYNNNLSFPSDHYTIRLCPSYPLITKKNNTTYEVNTESHVIHFIFLKNGLVSAFLFSNLSWHKHQKFRLDSNGEKFLDCWMQKWGKTKRSRFILGNLKAMKKRICWSWRMINKKRECIWKWEEIWGMIKRTNRRTQNGKYKHGFTTKTIVLCISSSKYFTCYC